jgi:hypothetical protein
MISIVPLLATRPTAVEGRARFLRLCTVMSLIFALGAETGCASCTALTTPQVTIVLPGNTDDGAPDTSAGDAPAGRSVSFPASASAIILLVPVESQRASETERVLAQHRSNSLPKSSRNLNSNEANLINALGVATFTVGADGRLVEMEKGQVTNAKISRVLTLQPNND